MSVTQSHVRCRWSSRVPNDNGMGIHDDVGAILSSMSERGDVPPVRQQKGAILEPTINLDTDDENDYRCCYRRVDLPVGVAWGSST